MLVVKIGGAAGVDIERIAQDIARQREVGGDVVVVHGGSDETNRLATALGHPPRFVTSVSGMTSRLTDRRTLEIFCMATARINRALVEELQQRGVDAIGLSGIDGRLLRAERKSAIRVVENGRRRVVRDDLTGRPTKCNTHLLRSLLAAGQVPVIAPLGITEDGEAVNVDGDRAAACVAAGLDAETLVLLTNVAGLYRDPSDPTTLVRDVEPTMHDVVATWAAGRMKKKVLGATEALTAGVDRVVIGDGRVERPIEAALAGAGTVFRSTTTEVTS